MRELRTVLPYLRPYRRVYLTGLGLTLVSNLLLTQGPRLLGQGIDALSEPSAVPRCAGRGRPDARRWRSLGGVARYGMRQLLNSGSRRVETDMRDVLFAHLEDLSADFYDRATIGDLMSRATNDLLNLRMAAGPAIMYLTDTITRTLLVVPYMLLISPRLTLLSLLPLIALPAGDDPVRPADPPADHRHPGPVRHHDGVRPGEPERGPDRPGVPAGSGGNRAVPRSSTATTSAGTCRWPGPTAPFSR